VALGAPDVNPDAIAVVGMACRVPGARDLDEFWRNLRDGVESVTFFTDDELRRSGVSPDLLADPAYVRGRPVIEDVDRFDAGLFGFTTREAELLDPQHRLFLELAFQALEDAGCDPTRSPAAVGVFGGVGGSTYGWYNLRLNPEVLERAGQIAIATSTSVDYLATMVSYRLNLRGPSVTVQTACSSSLVAVHLASESLRVGECDVALAGGASIEIPQRAGYLHVEGGIESPDGHCRAFDARARGTTWGSGGGVVALKRLEDALADGDRVLAVLLASAVNNDGADKVGFSAPSVSGQAAVVMQALARAGVDASSIGYVEAHGTGTAVGDPLEVAALTQVFRRATAARAFCSLGSVKTNIGHLSSAAGVVALIKTVLALGHGLIPPSLNFTEPNPRLRLDESPFRVNTELSSWEPLAGVRRAGVSSFGIGGTNAHVIVEEAPPSAPGGPSRPEQLLVLSTRTETALETLSASLAALLKRAPELSIADVAHTLRVGRRAWPHRRALVCRNGEDAAAALASPDRRRVLTGRATGLAVVFAFPGQGTRLAGSGRRLYEQEESFRTAVDQCAELLRGELELDVRALLFPADDDRDEAERRLEDTALAQPALFTVEYALAQLLLDCGVRPSAMIGHSLGEYVAACLAGVWTLESALRLVAARGRLLQRAPAGAMLAVSLAPDTLEGLLTPDLAIAALNGPRLSVAAGPPEAVHRLAAELATRKVPAGLLRTTRAFHSPMMDGLVAELEELVARHRSSEPSIPFLSNVSGDWIASGEARDPAYWGRHLRQTVRFGAGIERLLADGERAFVEVGPGRSLTGFVQARAGRRSPAVATLGQPDDRATEGERLLGALGHLWIWGADVDWSRLDRRERRRPVALPGHPLERQLHWIEAPERPSTALPRPRGKLPIERWFHTPVWREAPRPAPAGDGATAGPWLVFHDDRGLADDLAGRLRERGQVVVTVRAGGSFSRAGGYDYGLDPACSEHLDRLLAELQDSGLTPGTIVHALEVAATPARTELGRNALAASRLRAFDSLVVLAQALAARQVTGPLRLVVLTSHAASVTGGDLLRPAAALAAGPCLVLPLEQPHVRTQHLDLVLPEPGSRAWTRLAEHVTAELVHPAGDEMVAFRSGRRWLPGLEAVTLPEPGEGGDRLRRHGVYLVTGGLGAIGLAVAGYLARQCEARLALLARSPLPPRDRWDAWLEAHGADDRASRRISAVRELELAGSEVLVVDADVASTQDMERARAATLERFGELHGIVHAAGGPGGGMIEVKDLAVAAAVMAPKLEGAAVLAATFGDMDLDFVVLCSSVTAVAGGLGQVDYCAANAFLDALAHTDAFGSTPVLSIGWSRWSEAGMAVETGRPRLLEDPRRAGPATAVDHPLLTRVEMADDGSGGAVFTGELSAASHWALDEHRLSGVPVLPGTAYLEMARAAFAHLEGEGPISLDDVDFLQPLAVPDGARWEIRLELSSGPRREFRVLGRNAEGRDVWASHAQGAVRRALRTSPDGERPDAIAARCRLGHIELRGRREAPGLVRLGPHWSSLREVWTGADEELARLECEPDVAGELRAAQLHPALLDEATAFGDSARFSETDHYLPLGYGRLILHRPLPPGLFAHLCYRPAPADGLVTCDVTLMDDQGRCVAEVENFVLRRVRDLVLADGAQASGAPGAGRPDRSGITQAEGAEAFRRVLAWAVEPHVVVSSGDLDALLKSVRGLTRREVELEVVDAAAPAERTLETPYEAPRTDLERTVAALWSELLGASPVGRDDDFFLLGGNSLVAIQLVSLVQDRLGVQLPIRSLFEAPTVAGVARLLETALAAADPVG
jgi:phthiocerol/phenolphthiocerol synthesis type-I polyketide synthase E